MRDESKIIFNRLNKHFFSMAFYHSSLGAMNAARLLKKDVKKTHQFFIISMGKSGPSAQ